MLPIHSFITIKHIPEFCVWVTLRKAKHDVENGEEDTVLKALKPKYERGKASRTDYLILRRGHNNIKTQKCTLRTGKLTSFKMNANACRFLLSANFLFFLP